jgi:hypothetical protein
MTTTSYMTEKDSEYLLLIAGSLRFATFLGHWRLFKDHIRTLVAEQPGWADVNPSQSHREDEVEGWCRLKTKEEANTVFRACDKLSFFELQR